MSKPWFNEYGHLIKRIPKKAVEACSHQGECFEDVEHWQEKLGFSGPRNMMEEYLTMTGAWGLDELKLLSSVSLAQKVLWIACCDIRETGDWYGMTI